MIRIPGGEAWRAKRELGRGLRGAAGDELRLPATLREVVRGRLATVPPRAQELLRAAAILDDAFPVAIAARLIGRPVLECLPALDAAVASGLLVLESHSGTVRFTHALVRAALHDGLPLQQRVLLHARRPRHRGAVSRRPRPARRRPGPSLLRIRARR
ncbi:hypothetical protein [Nocardia sp. NPDC059239]|uniref:hypothetical protein n=1 Tax=unclassified Nocardia TaxID=2637762 RepID=UPI0036C69EA0